jgi:hypothetical protein
MDKDIQDINELNDIAYKNRDIVSVGVEEVYCACGCGLMIRNGHFFTCDHEEEYDD